MLVKKIVKRCIYGVLVLLYLGRMLKTDYLPFPLPGCIIPLIPAIMGGYLIVDERRVNDRQVNDRQDDDRQVNDRQDDDRIHWE
ncbi:hypothetical protein KY290_025700 [Solanum tuberosum]|uniref:Uncharacterized protein n=1 Tax=Solanum tuberosum TaxID=4113 RepID=A0ABQ7UUC1_SOLTU|nr:hypothetical protein KY290_025700 [Solanum tuberosum]